MSDDLNIDLEGLKVSEIEEIEEILGTSFDLAFADGQPKGRVLRALGYIVRKRDDPAFTLEQAGDLVIRLAASADPTSAAG